MERHVELEQKFLELHGGHIDYCGVQTNPFNLTKNEKGKCDKRAFVDFGTKYDVQAIVKHFQGHTKLGPCMVMENPKNGKKEMCMFGAIDVDVYQNPNLLAEVRYIVEKSNVPFVITKSSSSGCHLRLFFKRLHLCKDVRSFLQKFSDKYLSKYETEIFPKQDYVDKNGQGNFLYNPYFNTYNEPMQVALDDDNQELDLSGYINLIEEKRIDLVDIELSEWRANKTIIDGPRNYEKQSANDEQRTTADEPWIEILAEGPPCLQTLKEQKSQGYRNETLYQYGVMLNKVFGSVDVDTLEEINKELFTEPLKITELQRIVGSFGKKSYDFRCKVEPFKDVCNVKQCHINKNAKGYGQEVYNQMSNYIFVKNEGKVRRLRPNNVEMSVYDAVNAMSSEFGSVLRAENFKGEIKKYYLETASDLFATDTSDWDPSKPQFWERPALHGLREKMVNAYSPSPLKYLEEGTVMDDVQLFPEFIKFMCGEEEVEVKDRQDKPIIRKIYDIFLDWLAHMVQKPGEKTDVAIVIKSRGQGAGKSIISEIMEQCVGEKNFNMIDTEALVGNWADPFSQKIMVAIEEVYDMGASARKKVKSNVKKLITAQSQLGNMKTQKMKNMKLRGRMYFMSNENSALAIEKLDRRFLVINPVNDTPELLAKTKVLGTALIKWCEENNGYAQTFKYLNNRDLSKFNPRMRAPETKAKEEMVEAGMENNVRQFVRAVREQTYPVPEGCELFCPDFIAKLYGRDRLWAVDLFKNTLGWERVCEVQKSNYIIPPSVQHKSPEYGPANTIDVNYNSFRTHLWTSNPEIKDNYDKGIINKKDLMKQFAAPVKAEYGYMSKFENATWAVHRWCRQEGKITLPKWLQALVDTGQIHEPEEEEDNEPF